MAQTTTAINGCDGVIKVDNDAGNLQDISGSSNQITIERLLRTSDDVYTFSTDYPLTLTCGKKATVTIRIVYSTDELEGMQLFNEWYENHATTKRTVQIDLPDSTAGSDRYTFECLIERFTFSTEAGDANPIMAEIVLKPSGTFTWAQVGS